MKSEIEFIEVTYKRISKVWWAFWWRFMIFTHLSSLLVAWLGTKLEWNLIIRAMVLLPMAAFVSYCVLFFLFMRPRGYFDFRIALIKNGEMEPEKGEKE